MKISIITVCYNNIKGLEQTIKSVLSQTYHDLEFIVIDGDSKDGTKELAKKYPITFISEPDAGIYDAMNKGTKIATGTWLNFMNAGDFFYDSETVAKIVPQLDDHYDIIYGNTEIRYQDFNTIKIEPQPERLWMGRIPHQSAFIKKTTMEKWGYNQANKIVADLEFFLNIYYHGGKLKKIDTIVASFAKDGISETQDRQVIIDAHKTVKQFKSGMLVDGYYYLLRIKPIIKRMLPKALFKFLKLPPNLF